MIESGEQTIVLCAPKVVPHTNEIILRKRKNLEFALLR